MPRRTLLSTLTLSAAPAKIAIRKRTANTRSGIATIYFSQASGPHRHRAIKWFTPCLVGKDPGGIEDHWSRAHCQFSRYRDGSVSMTAPAAIHIAL